MESVPSWCDPCAMDSEDPLFIMYTSGTTGAPTGIIHTQAGYLLYSAMTHKVKHNYSTIPQHSAFSTHQKNTHNLLCSMCLTTKRERYLRVCLFLVGLRDTHMWCMVHSAMVPQQCSLRVQPLTLIPVRL